MRAGKSGERWKKKSMKRGRCNSDSCSSDSSDSCSSESDSCSDESDRRLKKKKKESRIKSKKSHKKSKKKSRKKKSRRQEEKSHKKKKKKKTAHEKEASSASNEVEGIPEGKPDKVGVPQFIAGDTFGCVEKVSWSKYQFESYDASKCFAFAPPI